MIKYIFGLLAVCTSCYGAGIVTGTISANPSGGGGGGPTNGQTATQVTNIVIGVNQGMGVVTNNSPGFTVTNLSVATQISFLNNAILAPFTGSVLIFGFTNALAGINASGKLTATLFSGNGGGLTNLPFIKTVTASGATVSFSENGDGSSNLNLTVSAAVARSPMALPTGQFKPTKRFMTKPISPSEMRTTMDSRNQTWVDTGRPLARQTFR